MIMMPIICISGGRLSHQVLLSNSFFRRSWLSVSVYQTMRYKRGGRNYCGEKCKKRFPTMHIMIYPASRIFWSRISGLYIWQKIIQCYTWPKEILGRARPKMWRKWYFPAHYTSCKTWLGGGGLVFTSLRYMQMALFRSIGGVAVED